MKIKMNKPEWLPENPYKELEYRYPARSIYNDGCQATVKSLIEWLEQFRYKDGTIVIPSEKWQELKLSL